MQKELENAAFTDLFFKEEEDRRIFCYRSGMSVYEEVFDKGRYIAAGHNLAGYPQDVLDAIPMRLDYGALTEPQAFDLEADGTSLSWDWDLRGYTKETEHIGTTDTDVLHVTVTLVSLIKPVTVRVHTFLDGTAVFTRRIEVINTSDRPLAVNSAAPLCGGYETFDDWRGHMSGAQNGSRVWSLGYMDETRWGHEGYFAWHDLPENGCYFGGKYLRDRHRQPFFMLRNNLIGGTGICQLGWSGGFRMSFDLDTKTSWARLALRVELDSQKPLIILDPGESFCLPDVHFGAVQGDMDDAVFAMTTHLRRSVFTLPDARGVKGWLEGGIGPEHYMDVRATEYFADQLSYLGAEVLIIDAGWFCPPGKECTEWLQRSGDWYPDRDRYPDGFAQVRDHIHSKGLLFGLWFDLERLGLDSKAAKEHPQWLSVRYTESQNSQLNMAIPEAAAWAESELSRCIEEYKLDLFRLDYNLGYFDLQNKIDRGSGPENAYVRYYQNTYAMYRRLRQKYPDVIFENCAGGGGRCDVGMMANFTHTWVSDWQYAPRSIAITNGMTMCLPPECVDRLLAGMGGHTRASLDFQARAVLFGRPSVNDFNTIGSEPNPDQLAFVKRTLDLYREFVRPMAGSDRIYHHTPEIVSGRAGAAGTVEQPQGLCVIERTAVDKSRGIIGVFALSDEPREDTVVRPRGVCMSARYEVTFDNAGETVSLTGYEMMNSGLRVRTDGALTSELITYLRRG